MFEDTYHYTLSTIPQVLSAMIAVIGALALFRIGDVQRQVAEHGGAITDRLVADPDERMALKQMLRSGRRSLILDALGNLGAAEAMPAVHERLNKVLVYRLRLIGALSLAIWVTVITIVVTVGLLAAAQLLVDRPDRAYVAMLAGFAMMLASLGANTHLAYLLLRT